jgi:hypothetical protein
VDKLKESLKELLADIVYDLIIKMEQIKGRKYYEKYTRNEVISIWRQKRNCLQAS